MALFIKPSSFFLKFFALILVFQVSVVLSADFIHMLVIEEDTKNEDKVLLANGRASIVQDGPSFINEANNPDFFYEMLGNLIGSLEAVENPEADAVENPEADAVENPEADAVENPETSNSPTRPTNLLLMNLVSSNEGAQRTPVIIPGIPSWILNGAVIQGEPHINGDELRVGLTQVGLTQGEQHNHEAVFFSEGEVGETYRLRCLSGTLPNGRRYIVHYNKEHFDEDNKKILDQWQQQQQQLDRQEENNHAESTDESSATFSADVLHVEPANADDLVNIAGQSADESWEENATITHGDGVSSSDKIVEDDSKGSVQGSENDIEAEATEYDEDNDIESSGTPNDYMDDDFDYGGLVSLSQGEQVQLEPRSPTPIPGHDKGKKESDGSKTDAGKNTGAIEENQEPIESDRREDQEEGADENTVEGQADQPVTTLASGHGQNNTSGNEEEPAVEQIEDEALFAYIQDIGTKDSQPNQDQ